MERGNQVGNAIFVEKFFHQLVPVWVEKSQSKHQMETLISHP